MQPPTALPPPPSAPFAPGVRVMGPPGTPVVPEGNSSHPGNYTFNRNVQPSQTDQSHRTNIRPEGTPEMGAIAISSAPPLLQPASQPARPSSSTAPSHFASNNFGNMAPWLPPPPSFQVPGGMPNTPLATGPPVAAYPSPAPQAVSPVPWLQPQQMGGFGRPPFSPYTAMVPSAYPMPVRGTLPSSAMLPDIQPPGVPVSAAVGASASSVAENVKHVGDSETKAEAPSKEQLDAWTSHRTENGTVYYYNAVTGESTYERPQGFKAESDKAHVQPTPVSWEKLTGTDWTLVTTNDGKRYYYNAKTQLSSWQVPNEVAEWRKRQEADALKAQSMSVVNTSIVTDKGSDPVTLSTPAATTGGRDAIVVKSPNVLGSSSALDLIKKKLQDSGFADSTSSDPALSGAVALELNGSKPAEGTGEGPQNENNKDKRKDANGDGDLSNSSSDSEDEVGGPTKEECILQFKEMLKERGVAPFSKWEKELPKIVFDPRFKAISNHSARRALFEHYVRTRAEEERKEKRAAQKAALEGFKQLLEEAKEDIDHNTDYQAFKRKWGDDPRFQALDRKERESLLNERVIPLKRTVQEKAQAERAAAISDFKSLLQDNAVTSSSRWSKVKDSLRSDPRYKSVKHEDREKLFNEYVAKLKASEEEIIRKSMAKQDEEEKLKERERALRKRKEREEQEVERVRQKARRKEAVESYQALLVETIKDPQASWTESKPKLEKDPQGRSANPHLDKSDLEKLFREHVKSLHEKCAVEFKSMLADVITAETAAAAAAQEGKTIITSWSTAKQVLKSDPRYNKMPRKDREALWRRHTDEIQRKQKKAMQEEEGNGKTSSRAHDRR